MLRGNRGDDTLSDRRYGIEDNKTDNFFLEVGLGVDTIIGFDHGQDRFWLPAELFQALGGTVDSNDVVNDTSFSKSLGHAQFFHNTNTHSLWYYDGGLGNAVQIATLSGFTGSLTYTDFLIVPGY